MRLNEYLNDGANMQEVCLMAYLRNYYESIIDETFDKTAYNDNHSFIEIARYHNCREQGYTISLWYKYSSLVYVTFFEHRNSDSICLLINKGKTYSECPTPDEVWGDRKDKYDYDKSFGYMHIEECGDYIINLLKEELHKAVEEDAIVKKYFEEHPEIHYVNAERRKEIIAEFRTKEGVIE